MHANKLLPSMINDAVPHRAEIETYALENTAASTRRAYQSAWFAFKAWCKTHRLVSLPAEPATVASYIVELAKQGRAMTTINRHLQAIGREHLASNEDYSPTWSLVVKRTKAGIRRNIGVASRTRKAPLLVEDIRKICAGLPEDLIGMRNRAVILIGFAGAYRRSEIVSLDLEDVESHESGLVITLRKGKTDQSGQGLRKGIPFGNHEETCPVRALRAWIAASGISSGPIFRGMRGGRLGNRRMDGGEVARIVKAACVAAGFDPRNYSGHSLRAGLATTAAREGAEERDIMRQTGHRSLVVRDYIREGNLFRDNAAARVGL